MVIQIPSSNQLPPSTTLDLWINISNSSPATDGDLIDGIVSVSLVHLSCSGVVLSTQVYPDLGGMYHLL